MAKKCFHFTGYSRTHLSYLIIPDDILPHTSSVFPSLGALSVYFFQGYNLHTFLSWLHILMSWSHSFVSWSHTFSSFKHKLSYFSIVVMVTLNVAMVTRMSYFHRHDTANVIHTLQSHSLHLNICSFCKVNETPV